MSYITTTKSAGASSVTLAPNGPAVGSTGPMSLATLGAREQEESSYFQVAAATFSDGKILAPGFEAEIAQQHEASDKPSKHLAE